MFAANSSTGYDALYQSGLYDFALKKGEMVAYFRRREYNKA